MKTLLVAALAALMSLSASPVASQVSRDVVYCWKDWTKSELNYYFLDGTEESVPVPAQNVADYPHAKLCVLSVEERLQLRLEQLRLGLAQFMTRFHGILFKLSVPKEPGQEV